MYPAPRQPQSHCLSCGILWEYGYLECLVMRRCRSAVETVGPVAWQQRPGRERQGLEGAKIGGELGKLGSVPGSTVPRGLVFWWWKIRVCASLR